MRIRYFCAGFGVAVLVGFVVWAMTAAFPTVAPDEQQVITPAEEQRNAAAEALRHIDAADQAYKAYKYREAETDYAYAARCRYWGQPLNYQFSKFRASESASISAQIALAVAVVTEDGAVPIPSGLPRTVTW